MKICLPPQKEVPVIKIQVVSAENLIPSIPNSGFFGAFESKKEKRYVEVYIERVRGDGSVLHNMLGKTTTRREH